ncbi:hypothetical protein C8Q78DRAFT_1142715 [Trametes maxima]|nr:hypothetical protein C8Q78DRAFT_1142715 [Trametes maxima]
MSLTAALPSLPVEAMLLLFTRPTNPEDDPAYGTLERLVEIGKRLLGTAYMDVLCEQQSPMPEVEVLRTIDTTLDHETVLWAQGYELIQKLRGVRAEEITGPEAENRRLFYAYTGAVFKSPDGGYTAIRRWIAAILGLQPSSPAPAYPPPQQGFYPPAGIYSTPGSAHGAPYQQPPPYPSPANAQHSGQPPLPGASSPPVTPSKIVPTYVPFLNQMAQKGRLDVQYETTSTGQPHLPNWTARCLSTYYTARAGEQTHKSQNAAETVGSTQKGIGQGATKQIAKEAAAREACYAMGWAPGAITALSLLH